MHILASGPEQQAVYFGHVIQAEFEKKGAKGFSIKEHLCENAVH
jgi:hypothetical protein